jgi:hypothetical protein
MENDNITLGQQLGIYDDFKDIIITDDQNNVITYMEFWDLYNNDQKSFILSKYDTKTKISKFIR